MIAMALSCCYPDILIADEPTTALDVTIQAQILALLEKLQKETGMALILITHDLGVVAGMAEDVLVMYAGKAVEYADVETIYYRSRHPYTWGLMSSVTRLDEKKKERLKPIKGLPPSLINLPKGCSFNPRCEFAKPICFGVEPRLEEISPGHWSACHFARVLELKGKKH
jgi:peptide/nickel transport system ATP-binding protein